MSRPKTPIRRNADGSRTITVQRCCNGCGEEIGDVTDAEIDAAMNGRPLPDVRGECPNCHKCEYQWDKTDYVCECGDVMPRALWR